MQSEICRLALTFEVYEGIASVVVVGLSDLVFCYTTTRSLRLALLYYMLLHGNGSKHKGEVVDKKRTFKTYAWRSSPLQVMMFLADAYSNIESGKCTIVWTFGVNVFLVNASILFASEPDAPLGLV
jgi:hypothetical protein